jgi:futalosine hydrolase
VKSFPEAVMKILLVSATAAEIRPFTQSVDRIGKEAAELYRYRVKNSLLDSLVTGIGMVPAAFFTGKYLSQGGYDLAIQAGICGSHRETIPPGTVTEVTEEILPELGSEEAEPFRDIFQLGLADPDRWPFRNGRLINAFPVESQVLRKLPKAKGSTVSTIGRGKEHHERTARLFSPDVESMEGAAFLFACMMQRVPNVQLRAVSNFVWETDRTRWDVETAVKWLNEVLGEIVDEMTN